MLSRVSAMSAISILGEKSDSTRWTPSKVSGRGISALVEIHSTGKGHRVCCIGKNSFFEGIVKNTQRPSSITLRSMEPLHLNMTWLRGIPRERDQNESSSKKEILCTRRGWPELVSRSMMRSGHKASGRASERLGRWSGTRRML